MTSEDKKRYNIQLDKKNTENIKKLLKGTGLTLSTYIDMLFDLVIENLEKAGIKPEDSITVEKLFEVLRIEAIFVDMMDRSLEDLIDNDPALALELMKKYRFRFSDRYYEKKRNEKGELKQ